MRIAGLGWSTGALQPYIKDLDVFECPAETTNRDSSPSSTSFSDFYFNIRLAERNQSDLALEANTILLGDGETASRDYACWDFSRCVGQNAAGAVGPVPQAAKLRHLDGANYAFTDGHVKWLKPNRIQQRKLSAETFGFPVR